MARPAASLYRADLSDLASRLAGHLARGLEQADGHPLVFFRADDVGVASRQFRQMIDCFRRHRLPLCLATVPAWLTERRLADLRRLTGDSLAQWCWHQHGRLHRNFEPAGKKQEFGPARNASQLRTSLALGKARLERLLGERFSAVFTPPWNRCSSDTLEALVALGFKAISRSQGASPPAPPQLPDFAVNVDLHTRKEAEPALALVNLLTEFEQAVASGRCGIMLHHQRMNPAALHLLDILLGLIAKAPGLLPVHFGELLDLAERPGLDDSAPPRR